MIIVIFVRFPSSHTLMALQQSHFRSCRLQCQEVYFKKRGGANSPAATSIERSTELVSCAMRRQHVAHLDELLWDVLLRPRLNAVEHGKHVEGYSIIES